MARPDLVRRVVRNIQRDGLQPTIEKVFAKLDTPIPLGYSLAGEVLEVGRRVGGVAVGDRSPALALDWRITRKSTRSRKI